MAVSKATSTVYRNTCNTDAGPPSTYIPLERRFIDLTFLKIRHTIDPLNTRPILEIVNVMSLSHRAENLIKRKQFEEAHYTAQQLPEPYLSTLLKTIELTKKAHDYMQSATTCYDTNPLQARVLLEKTNALAMQIPLLSVFFYIVSDVSSGYLTLKDWQQAEDAVKQLPDDPSPSDEARFTWNLIPISKVGLLRIIKKKRDLDCLTKDLAALRASIIAEKKESDALRDSIGAKKISFSSKPSAEYQPWDVWEMA